MVARLRPLIELIVMDSYDSLKPPAFDIMLVVIGVLGATLAALQPITDPKTAARAILEPTLFTASLFLALRGSAGITDLLRSGVLQVYMSYPLPRLSVLAAILASRIVVPAAILLSLPLIVAAVLLAPVVARDPVGYIVVYLAYLLQAMFYGMAFAAIALNSKSPGVSSVGSITFYFAWNVVSLILGILGLSMANDFMVRVGDAMGFQNMVYRALEGFDVATWQLLLVPAAALLITTYMIYYFTRRFEVV